MSYNIVNLALNIFAVTAVFYIGYLQRLIKSLKKLGQNLEKNYNEQVDSCMKKCGLKGIACGKEYNTADLESMENAIERLEMALYAELQLKHKNKVEPVIRICRTSDVDERGGYVKQFEAKQEDLIEEKL